MARIYSEGNRLQVIGRLELSDLRRCTAALYSLTTKLGYEDVKLDFSECTRASAAPMAALCSEVAALRARGVDAQLTLPAELRLANLFRNANWAYLLDPERQNASRYRGTTNMPLARFNNASEQTRVVDRLVNAVLSSLSGLEKGDFAALEWSLNEITDNVLVHAESPVGGLVQMTMYPKQQRVEFSVADSGRGIPTTLRQGHPDVGDDTNALERAIREGVTRDTSIGQGNGLFGTFEIARASHGYLHIESGYARLSLERDELRYSREDIPFHGSLIVAGMDCSDPSVLARALIFGGSTYSPLDYIDTHYEVVDGDELCVRVADEVESFGSRQAGTPLRLKLTNLVGMQRGKSVVVDLSGVELVSSSFADEVFGKLFVSLGPLQFNQALELKGVTDTVRALIDKAIMQRMRQAAP